MQDRKTRGGVDHGRAPRRERPASTRWRGVAPLLTGALLLAAWPAAHAQAADTATLRAFTMQPDVLPLPAAVRAVPAVAPPVRPVIAGALDDASLAQLRGGTETPWSDMRLSGTVGNNSAVDVVTGANSITDGAFSNASGLPMVIQNSGANVLIQNATIVNVQVR